MPTAAATGKVLFGLISINSTSSSEWASANAARTRSADRCHSEAKSLAVTAVPVYADWGASPAVVAAAPVVLPDHVGQERLQIPASARRRPPQVARMNLRDDVARLHECPAVRRPEVTDRVHTLIVYSCR